MPLGKMILLDLLLLGIVLCTFALCHHVIPRITAKNTPAPAAVSLTQSTPKPTAAPTPAAAVEEGTESTPEVTPEPTPEVTPEPVLTWREKFADKFTDEIVWTDNSYSSPNVSITIEKIRTEYTDVVNTDVYVADIYVADLESFKTCFAGGEFGYYAAEPALRLSSRANAILAINGDYADNQQSGFLVRNGSLYYSEPLVCDICVLYQDGTMETYGPGEYSVDEIIERGPVQTFKFGPELLDDGQAKSTFNVSSELTVDNPRAAVGYYEPGHYCFVVCDGRQSSSRGLEMNRLSRFMADLGCASAYNLDGGASAVMTFNGRIVNSPSNGGRDLGDILCIVELQEEEG